MATQGRSNSLAKYEREERVKLSLRIIGYVSICSIGALLIMMLGGPTFQPILSVFGLRAFYHDEAGVYADCSKRENRYNKFCNKNLTQADEAWRGLGKSKGQKAVPFSLSK